MLIDRRRSARADIVEQTLAKPMWKCARDLKRCFARVRGGHRRAEAARLMSNDSGEILVVSAAKQGGFAVTGMTPRDRWRMPEAFIVRERAAHPRHQASPTGNGARALIGRRIRREAFECVRGTRSGTTSPGQKKARPKPWRTTHSSGGA